MINKIILGKALILCLCGLFLFGLLSNSVMADSEKPQGQVRIETTSDARIAVENAWEIYHHAALGGTLSSPTMQSNLEMNLHRSRTLLADAYEAEEKGDMNRAEYLIDQIINITKTVITGSQEQKK